MTPEELQRLMDEMRKKMHAGMFDQMFTREDFGPSNATFHAERQRQKQQRHAEHYGSGPGAFTHAEPQGIVGWLPSIAELTTIPMGSIDKSPFAMQLIKMYNQRLTKAILVCDMICTKGHIFPAQRVKVRHPSGMPIPMKVQCPICLDETITQRRN